MQTSLLISSHTAVTVIASPLVSLLPLSGSHFLCHDSPSCSNLWPTPLKQHVKWCNENSEGNPNWQPRFDVCTSKSETPSTLVVFRSWRSLSHTEVSGWITADKSPATDTVIMWEEEEEGRVCLQAQSVVKGQWAITLDMYPNLCDPAAATRDDSFLLSG